MSVGSYKRLTIALVVLSVGLLALAGCLLWQYGWLSIRVALASEQMEIFDDMRAKALQSEPVEAADFLASAIQYYPSGTKQETGSRLDRMVERERSGVVRDIVAHLRVKTGEDLGAAPEPWIQKYAKK